MIYRVSWFQRLWLSENYLSRHCLTVPGPLNGIQNKSLPRFSLLNRFCPVQRIWLVCQIDIISQMSTSWTSLPPHALRAENTFFFVMNAQRKKKKRSFVLGQPFPVSQHSLLWQEVDLVRTQCADMDQLPEGLAFHIDMMFPCTCSSLYLTFTSWKERAASRSGTYISHASSARERHTNVMKHNTELNRPVQLHPCGWSESEPFLSITFSFFRTLQLCVCCVLLNSFYYVFFLCTTCTGFAPCLFGSICVFICTLCSCCCMH